MVAILLALAPSIHALIGQPVPDWPAKPASAWIQGGPLALPDLRGKVVLIRFFTGVDCPYCRASAPALDAMHDELGSRGLVVIGMYTPKPRPRAVSDDEVRSAVAAYGFRFPVAVDADWGALRRLWLDRVPDAEYTSSSLLIDRRGVLRRIHPGGTLAGKDYDEMRAAALALLEEPVTDPR